MSAMRRCTGKGGRRHLHLMDVRRPEVWLSGTNYEAPRPADERGEIAGRRIRVVIKTIPIRRPESNDACVHHQWQIVSRNATDLSICVSRTQPRRCRDRRLRNGVLSIELLDRDKAASVCRIDSPVSKNIRDIDDLHSVIGPLPFLRPVILERKRRPGAWSLSNSEYPDASPVVPLRQLIAQDVRHI